MFHGSTDLVREGFGSYSSRSVVMGGSAILDAAGKLRAVMRKRGGPAMGCAEAEIMLADGIARGPGPGAVTFAGLAADDLSAEGSYGSTNRTYSYGAHAAHVAVDPRTGAVEVIDYVAVEDVGRIINPATLHGQAVGAIVQGLGGVFLEHLVYDDEAQLLTGSLADYLLPTAGDFPTVRAVALEEKPAPHNPLGAKGGRRRRHHSGRRGDRQCGCRRLAAARRRTAGVAAVAVAAMDADRARDTQHAPG